MVLGALKIHKSRTLIPHERVNMSINHTHASFQYKEAVPLMGRSAILGEQRNNYFNDVACGKGVVGDYTFAITKSGMLCEFNNRRLLDKWVDLKVIIGATAVCGKTQTVAVTHNHFALFVIL